MTRAKAILNILRPAFEVAFDATTNFPYPRGTGFSFPLRDDAKIPVT
jgi:hypothetical protein